MKTKLLAAGTLIVAFLAGAIFEGFTKVGTANAFNAPQNAAGVAPRRVAPRPVSPTVVDQPVTYEQAPRPRRRRSWEREALIVLGSSGAGAAIGGAAGGGKGAGIGAVSGAVAGAIYDLATRNK